VKNVDGCSEIEVFDRRSVQRRYAATAEKVMAGAAGTTQYLVFVVINLMLTSLFIKKRLNSVFGICCDQFNVIIIIY
jgi:hypothetical protein